MINRTKVKESTQIKPGDNGDVLVMKDNAPEWSTPSDAGLAEQANVDSELSKKQDKLVAGDNIHIDGNTISADGKPTPIAIGTVTSGEVPMVSNSGTDTDVVLNFVLPKGEKGDPGRDGTQINSVAPLMVTHAPTTNGSSLGIAVGDNAKATQPQATALGSEAQATSINSVAIGYAPTAEGHASVAVGTYSTASGSYSTAIGGSSTSSSNKSTAVGAQAIAVEQNSTAIGSGSNAVSFGSTSIGVDSGMVSTTERDLEDDWSSIGRHSVAVGAGSLVVDNNENVVSFGNGGVSEYWRKVKGVVGHETSSFGPATRRLINVTDPTDPQDAATKNYVDTKIAEIPAGTEVNSLAPLTVDTAPTSSNPGSVAIGNGAVDNATSFGEPAVVIGENAVSSSNGGVAIGPEAKANERGVAIGSYSYTNYGVNIGTHSSVRPTRVPQYADSIGAWTELPSSMSSDYDHCVALGSHSVATEGRTVSVGSGVTTLTLSDDMTEEEQAVARAATDVPTRRIVNVTDPRDAQDAATKGYVDTQLTPINAKLQYVPENTNQILSQIQTNVEKAQSAADAKVASITAGTGISVDASNPTAPVVSTTGLATQADLTALQTTVTQLQATVTQLQSQLNNLTLETEEI